MDLVMSKRGIRLAALSSMRFRGSIFVVGLVVTLCRFVSPAEAQEKVVAPPAVLLSLKPTSSHLSLRLRAEDGLTQDYACDGPCVMEVTPGYYQLGVVHAGKTKWQRVDLSQSKTIEVNRFHRDLAVTGMVLLAAGASLVVVGGYAFIYGALVDWASDCPTPCGGGVSPHFLRLSLVGAGAGLVLAAVGGVTLANSRGPTIVEKPGVQPESPVSKAGAVSFALVPDPHTPRVPVAVVNLRF